MGGGIVLTVTAAGISEPGGRHAVFNSAQWSGDYVAASVNFIRLDIRVDSGGSQRVGIQSSTARWVSASSVMVATGTWQTIQFFLGDMTQVSGAGTLNDALNDLLILPILATDTPHWEGRW